MTQRLIITYGPPALIGRHVVSLQEIDRAPHSTRPMPANPGPWTQEARGYDWLRVAIAGDRGLVCWYPVAWLRAEEPVATWRDLDALAVEAERETALAWTDVRGFASMITNFERVTAFHSATRQVDRDTPGFPTPEVLALRMELVGEEHKELMEAIAFRDLAEVADAIGDLLYVVYGTARAFGIDADAVFAEVHRSNMSKLVDGRPLLREDGRVLKPVTFSPPDFTRILGDWKMES